MDARSLSPETPAAEEGFYLYSSSEPSSPPHSGNVFYRAANEQSAKALCRLFQKEYSSGTEAPYFSALPANETDPDEQVLLDEALSWLDVYDDPDPGVYGSPPTADMMRFAQYARRARVWESLIASRHGSQKEHSTTISQEAQQEDAASVKQEQTESALPQMSEEDRLNSALNLFFLLAQTYYRILEGALGMATWCSSFDLELNESYLWTVSNLQNLLRNHEALKDFPGTFELVFPDLYRQRFVMSSGIT